MKNKTIEEQWRKQIDAFTNQSKIIEVLTNKGDHKSIYKEIFDKLIKERFDEIIELTNEINQNDLIYYFKSKSEERQSALKNIKLLYESREAVIKSFNGYSSIVSEAKYKAKYGEGLKILTPKQML